MKIILATLATIASASRIGHHDDTFYQEYNVGGHSHQRTDEDEFEGLDYPALPIRPNLYGDDEDGNDHRSSHRAEAPTLDLGDEEVAKLNDIFSSSNNLSALSSSSSSSSTRTSSTRSSSSSTHHRSSSSSTRSRRARGEYYSDDEDSDHEHSEDDHSDEEDDHVHVSPQPRLTYSTSSHTKENNHYGFGEAVDINEYAGHFEGKVDDFDSAEEIWNQADYEERLETEAELMVALEAIRAALVVLDTDITELEDCIERSADHIGENYEHITFNDSAMEINQLEVTRQQTQLESLQFRCRDM